MSHSKRSRRAPAATSSTRRQRNRFLPLFAAIGIAVLLFSLIFSVLPALNQGDSNNGNTLNQLELTPGSEETEMRERLETNPDDVDAMIILANLLVNTGRGSEAIGLYERAVNLRPDDIDLRVAFGQTLMRSQHWLDAQLQFERAREINPDDPEPVYLLGTLYQSMNPPKEAEAKEMFETVIQIAPDSVYASRAEEALAVDSGSPEATP